MYGNSIQIPCISKTWIAAFLQSRTSLYKTQGLTKNLSSICYRYKSLHQTARVDLINGVNCYLMNPL